MSELQGAETVLIKYLQSKHFCDFFSAHTDKEQLKSLPTSLQKLQPFVHNGVVRVGGHLSQADVAFDLKHPIILPPDSHFTELIIRQYHAKVGHLGASHTWASLLQRFCIVKGGAAVRKSLGQRIIRKRRNLTVGKQLMTDLPESRLQFDHPPFYCVDVDCFGPLSIKQGRSTVKRYGCVITCLTMRAIHIEIAHSLDTDSFLNVLRRFVAWRGTPHQIFSDNGNNFVGAKRILLSALQSFNDKKIHHYCTQKGIEWSFNPPLASQMGGAWERMIRTIRKVLKGLLANQSMNDESCLTLMAEIEAIINSRTLIPIPFSDPSQEPLTPNHLLLLRRNQNLSPGHLRRMIVIP